MITRSHDVTCNLFERTNKQNLNMNKAHYIYMFVSGFKQPILDGNILESKYLDLGGFCFLIISSELSKIHLVQEGVAPSL